MKNATPASHPRGERSSPARGRASRALFADDGDFELRRDVVMEPNRHRGLAERLDRLVQRDPPALDLDPVPLQELHDVLRGHRAEELSLLGGLPALLGHEGPDQLALVSRAAPRDPARDDLAAVADEASEPAHILVVDEVNFVGAKLADFPPAEPAALDGLLDCRNRSLLPATALERDVVLGGPRLFRERLGGRHGGRRGGLAPPHELDALGHHLHHRPLLAVPALPLPPLEAAVDQDRATLVEVLAAGLRLLAPDDDRDERGLLALLAPLRRVVAVDRKPQVGHGGAARRVAQLWGAGQVTDQEDLVEARHQPTSSSTSGVFAGRAFLRIGTRVERKRSTLSLRRSCRSNSFII